MKFKLVFLLVFSFAFVSAQKENTNAVIQVEYDIILNDTTDIESFQRAFKQTLVSDGERSHQTLHSHIDTTLYSKYGTAHSFNSEYINRHNYFKNITESQINYGMEYGFYETELIRDDWMFVNFKDGNETKKILGYKCKQQFVSFRGRDYEIYYATELSAYKDGPWKFMGAPGLILEVRSLDGSVSMKATDVNTTTVLEVKNMPDHWGSSLGIGYDEFVKRYRLWREEVVKKNKFEDPNIIVVVPYRDFEIYKHYFVDNHRY
tara:strand:- start:563 stop:1348 length:786 start_codon:yes stop_codon:yes gene_type:complete